MYTEPAVERPAPTSILRSIAALAGGEVLARVVTFGATALLARRLGPEGFGVVGFAVAVCGYLTLAVNSGLHDVGTREVARAPERAIAVYSSVATVRLLLACAAFAVLALLVGLLPHPPATRLVVLLTGLTFFSFAIDPTWVLRGLERPLLAGAGLVLAQLIYAGAVVATIQGPGDVVLVPVLQFAGELTAALALALVLVRGARPSFALADGLKILRSSRYLGLARLLRTLVVTFDVLLLGFLTTERDLGLYMAAYRFTFLLMAIVSSVSYAYLPSYTRAMTQGPEPTRRLVETSLGVAVTIGAPLVAGSIVTASQLLPILFGSEYAGAAPAFRLLALSVGLLFLNWSLSNVLIVAHKTRLQAAVHGAAAAINVALNVLLIPLYGIVGSAAATVVAELTVVVAGIEVLRRMHILPSAMPMMRPLTAAAVMSVVVWLLAAAVPLALQIVVGGVTYVVVLVSIGGLPAIDHLRRTRSA